MFDDLRISILLIGTLFIIGIYLWDYWHTRRKHKQDEAGARLDDINGPVDEDSGNADQWDIVPLLRHNARWSPVEDEQLREFAGISGRENKTAQSDEITVEGFSATTPEVALGVPLSEQLFVLTVFAQEDVLFTGPTLSDLFDHLDLHYGELRIFHRLDDASGQSVFSVASIIEPGYFDLRSMHELRTPGLVLFMRLPGPLDGQTAFADMYATAKELAALQEGRIGDQMRNLLTDETFKYMRADAARYPASET
ncbi:MAG: cell division protein ZipA C-terminal FtsZ-binding domain-containing protein [Thiohalomonadaceae bacterium]